MKAKQLERIGIPGGQTMKLAIQACAHAAQNGFSKKELRSYIENVSANPERFTQDPLFGELALELVKVKKGISGFQHRQVPAPYKIWGSDLDSNALQQMENAAQLPISVKGALMPDAHMGYGLPIGGVLATKNAVIPYAVGMDIACRMKLTVLELPVSTIDKNPDRLKDAINRETRFGVGATFKKKHNHQVMDEDWNVVPLLGRFKDKAWSQLGTSGSGNHFVEFGELHLKETLQNLEPGTYLALLSHSGSRGTGAEVAKYYSSLAMRKHPELPKSLRHLAWFDLNSNEGLEYWQAMELMGRYAAANHQLIHRFIARNLGVKVLLDIENHHNFAWKEKHDGQNVIVHRKGATPADKNTVGIIPGSMATPGFVVRGLGQPDSLNSASHGAGRRMSRKQAKKNYQWKDAKKILENKKVSLISAGLDEVPMAYKNINDVMAAQEDLVSIIARFDPRIVKMAPSGEPPED